MTLPVESRTLSAPSVIRYSTSRSRSGWRWTKTIAPVEPNSSSELPMKTMSRVSGAPDRLSAIRSDQVLDIAEQVGMALDEDYRAGRAQLLVGVADENDVARERSAGPFERDQI